MEGLVKILLVNMFYNEEGGAQKSTMYLAEQLYREGHQVFVYSNDAVDRDVNEEKNGVKIFRRIVPLFDLHYIFKSKKNIFKHFFYKTFETYNIFAKKKFTDILDEVHPDIVHFNTISGMSLSIVKEAKKRNIKTAWTLRDYWLEFPWGSKNNLLIKTLNAIYRPFVKNSLKNLDIITAPSAFTLSNFIDKKYLDRDSQICKVIENAVVFSREHLEQVISEKRKNVRPAGETKFLFVGSILELKGIFNLVSTFKKLAYPSISLQIVGKGKDTEKLLREIEGDDRISYLGFKNTEELYEIYQKSDVLLVPSEWDEPFGRVVIEGNANGLPVIGSNRGGIPEILQTTKGGEIFDDGTENDLFNVMKKFIEDTDYNTYYDNILENIDTYSIEKQCDKFLELYES